MGNRGTLSPKTKCQWGVVVMTVVSMDSLHVYPAPLPVRLVTLVKLPHFSICQFPQL